MEREQHEASGHAQYRSWCRHCLAGKGRTSPHVSQGTGDLPEIGFDYGYLSREHEKALPLICAKDQTTQALCASVVPAKGNDAYAISFLVGWLRGLGWKRLVMRSDSEPALLSLLRLVSANLQGIEVVEKTCPEGDHATNGLAELAVRETKAHSRIIKSQLEERLGRRLELSDPLFAWLPRHATNCVNRYHILDDGKTPERRRTGRRWTRPEVEFGEVVMFRPVLPKALKGTEERMVQGVFVGHHERTGSTLLLSPEGLKRGTRIQRLPESERWNLSFIQSVKGLPWEVAPRQRSMGVPAIGDSERELSAPILSGVAAPPQVRRRCILKQDIERYGGTEECPACTRLAIGASAAGVPHSDACRERITELMQRDEDEDVQERLRADKRKRNIAPDEEVEPDREPGEFTIPTAEGEDAFAPSEVESETMPVEPDELQEREVEGSEVRRMQPQRAARAGRPLRDLPSPESRVRARSDDHDDVGAKRPERRGPKRVAETQLFPQQEELEVRESAHPVTGEGASSSSAAPPPSAAAPGGEDTGMGSLERVRHLAGRMPTKRQFLRQAEELIDGAFQANGMEISAPILRKLATACVEVSAVDVEEVYRMPKFSTRNGWMGMRSSFCVDLASDGPNGTPWNLSVNRECNLLERTQELEKPELISGALDTSSILLQNSNQRKSAAAVEELADRYFQVYQRQLGHGRHFLFEAPATDQIWDMDVFKKSEKDPRVHTFRGPTCRWESWTEDGTHTNQHTRWMTSSGCIASKLKGVSAQGERPDRIVRRPRDDGPVSRPGLGKTERNAASCRTLKSLGDVATFHMCPETVLDVVRALQKQMLTDGRITDLQQMTSGPVPDEEKDHGGMGGRILRLRRKLD